MSIEKRGFRMPANLDLELSMSGFEQRGHWTETPLTDADREAHAAAVAALTEIESNPWIEDLSYESELRVKPLDPKRKWTPDETWDEYRARWEAAGRPNLHRDPLGARIIELLRDPGPGGTSFGAATILTRGDAA